MVKFRIAALLLPFISAQDPCSSIQSVGDILQEYLSATFRGEATASPTESLEYYHNYDNEEVEGSGSNRLFDPDHIANFLVNYYQYAAGTPDSELVDPVQDMETNRNYRLLKSIVQRAREDDDPERIPSELLQTICIRAHDKIMSGDMRAVNCMTTNPSGNCIINIFLAPVASYGCWCYLGDTITEGKGAVQDSLDQLCKDMQLCMRCARMDNAGCDPITQSYTAGWTLSPLSAGNTADCIANNAGNACAADICCCEQDFLSGLMGTLFASQLTGAAGWNSNFMHTGSSITLLSGGSYTGAFDPDVTCAGTGVTGASSLDCCGVIPRRFPYSTVRKSCCGDEILYNPAIETCCHTAPPSSSPYVLTGSC